jgi:hypothetical protein
MTLVQARVPTDSAHQLDVDLRVLGLPNRSEAIRVALRLLHREARHAALAQDYDAFYGVEQPAPLSDVAAFGDVIAAEGIADGPAGR